MKLRLPKKNRDLRMYVLCRRGLQIGGYLLFIAAFYFGADAYNRAHTTYPPHRLIIGWRMAVWILSAVLLGFVLFRIWKLFLDRSFEGVVEKSGLSHDYTASADPGVANPVSYDFRLHSALVVRTPNGKKRHIRFEQKPGFYLYYYEGTHICHFAGLPYPVHDPDRTCRPPLRSDGAEEAFDDLSGGVVCVACGFMNKRADVPCGNCMHSLIDPRELWGDQKNDQTED